MSRALDDLDERFKPVAIEFLARLTETGVPVLVVDTLRTKAEHQRNITNGTTKIKRSKHCDGLAMDVCPWDEFRLHGPDKLQWNATDPVWQRIGHIAERLGLRWGGRFNESEKGKGDGWDPGHVEWPVAS